VSLAVLPTLYVGVAFGYGATDPAPVFTDVSAFVLPGWDCKTGRDHESDRVRVGTLTMTFRDPDGRFNALNAASPYAPNIRPMVPIRVTETVGGVTYPVFRGFVERWPPSWSKHGRFGTVTVTAVDMLAPLAATTLRTALDEVSLADSPDWLYPLDEPQGATAGVDLIAPARNGFATVVSSKYGAGTVAWGATTTLFEAPTGVRLVNSTNSSPYSALSYLALGGPVVPTGAAWSLECWFSLTASGGYVSLFEQAANDRQRVQVYVSPTGTLAGVVTGASDNGTGLGGGTVVTDGRWHHVVLSLAADLMKITLYLDGAVNATAVATAAINTAGMNVVAAGGPPYRKVGGTAWIGLTGSLARLAQYPVALLAARVLEHYRAGTQSFYGDTYAARATRLLDYAGWTGPRSIAAGSSQMLGATGLAGTDALTALEDNAESEGGVFYADRDGTVVAEGRGSRFLRTTPALILGDGPGEVPYAQGIAPDYDLTYMANRVTATRPYGVTAVATDTASRAWYFERTRDLTVRITSDAQTVAAANFTLARYSQPRMRIGLVTLNLTTLPTSDVQKIEALSIGARVRVAVRPIGQPGFTADFFVESIGRRTATNSSLVELTLSPAFPKVWIVGDPVYGVINSDNVIAY